MQFLIRENATPYSGRNNPENGIIDERFKYFLKIIDVSLQSFVHHQTEFNLKVLFDNLVNC